jgi:hypothetical protein
MVESQSRLQSNDNYSLCTEKEGARICARQWKPTQMVFLSIPEQQTRSINNQWPKCCATGKEDDAEDRWRLSSHYHSVRLHLDDDFWNKVWEERWSFRMEKRRQGYVVVWRKHAALVCVVLWGGGEG